LEAVQIWTYPETNYQKIIEEKEIYSLDEEVDYKGKKIKKISIQNQEFEVKNWWFAVESICKFLYSQSPTEFKHAITSPDISRYFSQNPDSLNGAMEFLDGWYVDCGRNTNSNVKLMSKLCDLLNFDKSEVEIEIS